MQHDFLMEEVHGSFVPAARSSFGVSSFRKRDVWLRVNCPSLSLYDNCQSGEAGSSFWVKPSRSNRMCRCGLDDSVVLSSTTSLGEPGRLPMLRPCLCQTHPVVDAAATASPTRQRWGSPVQRMGRLSGIQHGRCLAGSLPVRPSSVQ